MKLAKGGRSYSKNSLERRSDQIVAFVTKNKSVTLAQINEHLRQAGLLDPAASARSAVTNATALGRIRFNKRTRSYEPWEGGAA